MTIQAANAIALAVEIDVPEADKVEIRFVCPDGSVHHAPAYVLYQEYSDFYKEMHGIRPRWMQFTPENIGRLIENLFFEYEQHQKAEKAREKQAIADMEAAIQKAISLGANTRRNAVRWLMEAEGTTDWSYFEYCNSVPYGYFKKYYKKVA